MSDTKQPTRYAIVWAIGKDLYTHEDENSTIVSYSKKEVEEQGLPLYDEMIPNLTEKDGKAAVSLWALNMYFGV